jgi:hypothetical protein
MKLRRGQCEHHNQEEESHESENCDQTLDIDEQKIYDSKYVSEDVDQIE